LTLYGEVGRYVIGLFVHQNCVVEPHIAIETIENSSVQILIQSQIKICGKSGKYKRGRKQRNEIDFF